MIPIYSESGSSEYVQLLRAVELHKYNPHWNVYIPTASCGNSTAHIESFPLRHYEIGEQVKYLDQAI